MKTSLHLALLLALAPAPVLAQQKFDTPEAAVAELVKLAGNGNVDALGKLLGPEYVKFRKGQDAGRIHKDVDPEAYVAQVINLVLSGFATHACLRALLAEGSGQEESVAAERLLVEMLRVAKSSLFLPQPAALPRRSTGTDP